MSSRNRPGNAGSSHWSRYWASGALTSLPQDFTGNYDGEIAAFWHEICADLPTAPRIVDACTGNGAVALLVADYCRNHDMDAGILAVDASHIDTESIRRRHPELSSLLEHVRFVPDTRLENLDLPAASVDLVTSQYGLEYCDWKSAARRITELLRPGGRLALIHHAPDSDMLATMTAEKTDYDLLHDQKLFRLFERFAAGDVGPDRLRRELESSSKPLRARYGESGSPLLGQVLQAIGQVMALPASQPLEPVRVGLGDYTRELRSAHGRMTDMLSVYAAIHDDPEWHRCFEAAGLEAVRDEPVVYAGRHNAGHARVYRKPED